MSDEAGEVVKHIASGTGGAGLLFGLQVLWEKVRGAEAEREEKAWREGVTEALHEMRTLLTVLKAEMERENEGAEETRTALAQLRRDHEGLRSELAEVRATVNAILREKS